MTTTITATAPSRGNQCLKAQTRRTFCKSLNKLWISLASQRGLARFWQSEWRGGQTARKPKKEAVMANKSLIASSCTASGGRKNWV
jgi:hypothetical protein